VDFIYASHVLEHLYKAQAGYALAHFYSKLKKGGVLRICSPDYDLFIDEYCSTREIDPIRAAMDLELALLAFPNDRPRLIDKVSAIKSSHIHFWHPTVHVMKSMLEEVGYLNIRIEKFRRGDFPDLEQIENRDDHSFYITAEK